jgi:sugar phosphate isomerase/epimerase
VNLAFSKPTFSVAEQRSLFGSYRTAGYTGLQLKSRQYEPYLSAPERFAGEWGDDPALVNSLIAMDTLDEAGIRRLRALFGFAAAVRSERIVFCLAVSRSSADDDDIRDFAKTLSQLGNEARRLGIRLSLHHHYDQPVMYRRDFETFCTAADKDSVSLTLDTAHLAKSGIGDIASVLADYAEYVDNIHLKDLRNGEFRLLGQGDIEFGPFFDVLRRVRYDGALCIDEESGASLEDGLSVSHRYVSDRLP